MEDIIYFELNDWLAERDYPNEEPFLTWLDDNVLVFSNKKWVKNQDITVTEHIMDMSVNYCIGATKSWIQTHCPSLLTKYSNFIMEKCPTTNSYVSQGGCPVMEYNNENKGKIFSYDLVYNETTQQYDYKLQPKGCVRIC